VKKAEASPFIRTSKETEEMQASNPKCVSSSVINDK
jgi:hypothetical protein